MCYARAAESVEFVNCMIGQRFPRIQVTKPEKTFSAQRFYAAISNSPSRRASIRGTKKNYGMHSTGSKRKCAWKIIEYEKGGFMAKRATHSFRTVSGVHSDTHTRRTKNRNPNQISTKTKAYYSEAAAKRTMVLRKHQPFVLSYSFFTNLKLKLYHTKIFQYTVLLAPNGGKVKRWNQTCYRRAAQAQQTLTSDVSNSNKPLARKLPCVEQNSNIWASTHGSRLCSQIVPNNMTTLHLFTNLQKENAFQASNSYA